MGRHCQLVFMSNNKSSIISPGEKWDKYLNIFNKFGLNDIYFNYRYLNLYISKDSQALIESFVFQSDGEIFFLPYIRRPIMDSSNLWDFETVYGYSGPISTNENTEFLELAWQNFKRLMNKIGIIAGLIRFHPFFNNDRFCTNNVLEVHYDRDTVWMDCNRDLAEVLSNYPKKQLQKLKSLESRGITVRSSNDVNDLHKFGEIYLQRMRSIVAREEYHFSFDYFDGITKLGSNNWMVYLAFSPNNKIMGGCLLLFSERFCHYHLAGSLNEYIKYNPNDILLHTIIQDLLESNIEKMHFGGGRTSDTNDGLFSFKLKFSKQLCQFKVGYCVVDEKKYKSLCERWEAKYPEKQAFANFFLKYRY